MSDEYDDDVVEVVDDINSRPVSRIPAHAPQPQDRKPKKKKKAVHAEAVDGFLSITVAGVDLRIPIKGKMPVKAAIKYSHGDEFGGSEALLGTAQWEAFLDADPTVDDYNILSEAIKEATGN
ncbi:MAG TPA: adenylosuccinate synthase [Gordonia sp. (in: high G+C Gram-positive bacteria)]|jgi:hypothetical protein|nr:adenylosuccinate synthase [Gordonia sp. (in: high G+C Gram-positive bacteria)]